MFEGKTFYHAVLRSTVVAFGRLFSSVYIERREIDSVAGELVQTLQIPITYAPKEKWLVRLEQDPTLENQTYTTLPRMSFEITGYNYDPARKLQKNQKIVCHKDGSSSEMYAPVPYNIDISLYVLTKTQEDGLQIIEQILPTFSPEYTMSIMAVPQMNIVQDIPIILNNITVNDEYDGDFQTRRFITHTLNFTIKLNLYGYINQSKPIYHTEVDIDTKGNGKGNPKHKANGDPATGVITDEWIFDID